MWAFCWFYFAHLSLFFFLFPIPVPVLILTAVCCCSTGFNAEMDKLCSCLCFRNTWKLCFLVKSSCFHLSFLAFPRCILFDFINCWKGEFVVDLHYIEGWIGIICLWCFFCMSICIMCSYIVEKFTGSAGLCCLFCWHMITYCCVTWSTNEVDVPRYTFLCFLKVNIRRIHIRCIFQYYIGNWGSSDAVNCSIWFVINLILFAINIRTLPAILHHKLICIVCSLFLTWMFSITYMNVFYFLHEVLIRCLLDDCSSTDSILIYVPC